MHDVDWFLTISLQRTCFKICHWFSSLDFFNRKDLEPCILQNAELLTHLTSSNYQSFAKKGKSEVCAFIVMLLIVIQELLQYCETLKAS